MGINKVNYGNTTLIDISDTTATAEDVVDGLIFYEADGSRVEGTFETVRTATEEGTSVALGGTFESLEILGSLEGIKSINLFDRSTTTQGYYLNASGAVSVDVPSEYSALIPVEAGQTYTVTGICSAEAGGNKRFHIYDSEGTWKQQIDYINATVGTRYTRTFTIPSGGAYLRISIRILDQDVMVIKGSSAPAEFVGYNQLTVTASKGTNISTFNVNFGNQLLGATDKLVIAADGSVTRVDFSQTPETETSIGNVTLPSLVKGHVFTVSAITPPNLILTYIERINSILTTKTITENGIYNAENDNADGYFRVTINTPITTWYGSIEPEFLFQSTWTKKVTDAANWPITPTTSAQALTWITEYTTKANTNATYDRYGLGYNNGEALDFGLYNYIWLEDGYVEYAYDSDESTLNKIHVYASGFEMAYHYGARPRSASGNIILPTSDTYGAYGTCNIGSTMCLYRNASNAINVANNTTYGISAGAIAPSTSSTSSVRPAYFNLRVPSFGIRAHDTYMPVASYDDLDFANTKLHFRLRIYRVPARRGIYTIQNSRLLDMINDLSFPDETI